MQTSSGASCLIFCRTLRLLPYFMCANSEGSGESVRMRRLASAFAGRLCDKYHNLMSWLNFTVCYHMSHVMRKPVYAICEQQMRRSGADQPAHSRSLISAFVVRCLDSIISLVSIYEISSLYLVSLAAQAGLTLPWSQTPKTGFIVIWLI